MKKISTLAALMVTGLASLFADDVVITDADMQLPGRR